MKTQHCFFKGGRRECLLRRKGTHVEGENFYV